MNRTSGSFGLKARICTSGWLASNGSLASPDMSVKSSPALRESMMLRPFDLSAPAYGGSSPYWVWPPIITTSGFFGDTAIGMSYEHCCAQMSNEV